MGPTLGDKSLPATFIAEVTFNCVVRNKRVVDVVLDGVRRPIDPEVVRTTGLDVGKAVVTSVLAVLGTAGGAAPSVVRATIWLVELPVLKIAHGVLSSNVVPKPTCWKGSAANVARNATEVPGVDESFRSTRAALILRLPSLTVVPPCEVVTQPFGRVVPSNCSLNSGVSSTPPPTNDVLSVDP